MVTRILKDAACVVIPDKDGNILTVTRRHQEILCLPGGKVDPGETTLEAAIREVHEETGIKLGKNFLTPIYSEIILGADGNDFYCTTFVHEQIVTPRFKTWSVEEGIQVRFVPWAELFHYGTFVDYNIKVQENYDRWLFATNQERVTID